MRHVPTLLRRELGAYFLGPMAFLILLAFQFVAWLNFWELVDTLSLRQEAYSSLRDPLNNYISGSTPFWIALLVAIPALTMRLIAEERRTGTIETLLTVPVTETEVVVGKWLAGVVMYCVMLIPFGIYLPFLYYQGNFDFDIGPIIAVSLVLGVVFVTVKSASFSVPKRMIWLGLQAATYRSPSGPKAMPARWAVPRLLLEA